MPPAPERNGGAVSRAIRLAATISVALAGPLHAEADGPDYFRVTGVKAGDVLNIRVAPDAGAAKIGEIPPGADGLRNLGCEGGLNFAEWQQTGEAERAAAASRRWCRISFDGVEGWVAARYLVEGAARVQAQAPVTADASAATGDLLAWRLVAVNGLPASGDPEIGFGPDGAIAGGTGCNRFQARGHMEGGRLVIDGPVATTRMACPDPLDAQERQVLSVLQGSIGVGFEPLAGVLELSNAEVRLTLRPATAAPASAPPEHAFSPAPAEAAAYWSVFGFDGHLNIRAEAGIGAAVVARVVPGTVMRAFGCSEGASHRWCEVETLDGTQTRGWAAAEFLEPATSALRAGQEIFDAIGHIPCAQAAGQLMDRCEFGVARDPNGSATIVVIRLDGTRRALFFENGAFLSADTSQADGYPETSATREADLTFVRVGDERYEIPDAVLYGG